MIIAQFEINVNLTILTKIQALALILLSVIQYPQKMLT